MRGFPSDVSIPSLRAYPCQPTSTPDRPAGGPLRRERVIGLHAAPLIDLAQHLRRKTHLKTFAEHSRNLRNFRLTRNLRRTYVSYVSGPSGCWKHPQGPNPRQGGTPCLRLSRILRQFPRFTTCRPPTRRPARRPQGADRRPRGPRESLAG